MGNHESTWDKLLQIKTTGRDETNADQYHHPYEPTPYCVLERLADSGLIREEDVVLDYGCGKGRVGFFLSHRTMAKSIGIEYDERIYRAALENQRTSLPGTKPDFVLTRAEAYEEGYRKGLEDGKTGKFPSHQLTGHLRCTIENIF